MKPRVVFPQETEIKRDSSCFLNRVYIRMTKLQRRRIPNKDRLYVLAVHRVHLCLYAWVRELVYNNLKEMAVKDFLRFSGLCWL